MHELTQAREEIRRADALFITAGAGMGVDSGMPDFRGKEGFWRVYPVAKKLGLSFEQLANPDWFHLEPRRAWGFYGHRFNLYSRLQPHQGYQCLRHFCISRNKDFFVFTSNVDGHFQKAGFSPDNILECHGSIHYWQCLGNCGYPIWASQTDMLEVGDDLLAHGILPSCPACGAIARPNILMFGDSDWDSSYVDVQRQRYQRWLGMTEGHNIVAIEVGAGTAIPTVRIESERRANYVMRINPRESQGGSRVISLPMGGMEALNFLCAE